MAGGLSYESWKDAPVGAQARKADGIIEKFRNASSQLGAAMKEAPPPKSVAASGDWIPVTERLPLEGVEVLALCYHHESWQPQVCYLSPQFKGRWITSIAGQWMMTVSHWMPLPALPKEVAK